MAQRLYFSGTRQARGSFRLDVWSYTQKAWVPNCFYREVDLAAIDRRVCNIGDGKGEVRLVDVRGGKTVAEWADSRRKAGVHG